MTFISLRKHAPEPEVDDAFQEMEGVEMEDAAEDAASVAPEPEGSTTVGLPSAIYLGACNWCAWCSQRISASGTVAVHALAAYAAVHYNAWVTTAVVGPLALAVLAFAPREPFERLASLLEARDEAREARRQARIGEAPPDAPEEPHRDPLVALLWRLIGEAPGTHLKTLAEALAEGAQIAGEPAPSRAEVEAKLEALEIPLRASVRDARGKVNRGVHRDDLTAWEHARSPTNAPAVAGPCSSGEEAA
jgi:hypothetical protein